MNTANTAIGIPVLIADGSFFDGLNWTKMLLALVCLCFFRLLRLWLNSRSQFSCVLPLDPPNLIPEDVTVAWSIHDPVELVFLFRAFHVSWGVEWSTEKMRSDLFEIGIGQKHVPSGNLT